MRKFVVVLAAVLLMGVGAVVAYASIPGPDGVIHGCRKNSDGSLRVIDSAASCPSGWTALNWSQTGPQGPAGVPGISGYEVVSASATPVEGAPGLWVAGPANATCPTGKVPLGGGATTGDDEVNLSESSPNGNGGWLAAANATFSAWQLNVYAICATVAS
jgi:hypothetical protein